MMRRFLLGLLILPMALLGASLVPFNPQSFTVVAAGGGGTPLTITSSTCVHWYDSDDITQFFQDTGTTTAVAANNDPVGDWRDKGTAAEHFTQGTAGSRPLYKTGLLDSKPGVVFDGTDDRLAKTLTSLSAHTVFIVMRSDTGAPTYGTILMDAGGLSGVQVHTTPGVGYVQTVYSGGDHASSTTALDSYSLLTFDYNGTGTMNAWKGCVTPVQFMTAQTGMYASGAKIYGVMGTHDAGSSEPLKGAILQVIIYNTVLGSTDRAAVQAWIHAKYPSLP